MNKTEAIKRFLESKSIIGYTPDMECQVNVAKDDGEPVEGEFKGKRWRGYTDNVTTWKPFRIPWKASSTPEYTDSPLTFDLGKHVEGIGMTGYDYKSKVSRWVAFDFDSLIGHKSGISNDDLEKIKDSIKDVAWTTLKYSSGGKGLHLYVHLNVNTENHNEHAALARSVLGLLSALTGFDFKSKVDTCGSNIWVWHRKSIGQPNAFQIIKQGVPLTNVPSNWKDHLTVITNKRVQNRLGISDEETGQYTHIDLDEEHKKLTNYLQESNAAWWFDSDKHLLVCHTSDLKSAYKDLGFKGIFDTLATGKDKPDHNCYLCSLPKGAWVVRRFGKGIQEHISWSQDSNGNTRCYLNREPNLETAARTLGGLEDDKKKFCFTEAETAMHAANALGANVEVPNALLLRNAKLSHSKDGRLIFEIDRDTKENPPVGWLAKKQTWMKILNITRLPSETETIDYDNIIRHLVTPTGVEVGWRIKVTDRWHNEGFSNVKLALESLGINPAESKNILGSSIFKCWYKVNKPFEPEFPGNREWNVDAAQLKFIPTVTDTPQYPHWNKILQHCGSNLDSAIKTNDWCKENGILTGADYLKCWIASVFQFPMEPLPFLFFYGPQASGKSIFHEALELLLTKGYIRADAAITSTSGFNGELQNAIIAVIEETDLQKHKVAANRIKDWVTSRHLNIRNLYETAFLSPNSLHFIQCSNEPNACPIFPGDTRITMIHVPNLTDSVPKKKLIPLLINEAPDFLKEILSLEIPESDDRLHIPVITSNEKIVIQNQNESSLETFIKENCFAIPGAAIKFSEFYDRFREFLDAPDVGSWTKQKLGKALPPHFPKGRGSWDGAQFYIGNISFSKDIKESEKLILSSDGFLRSVL